MLLGPTMNAKVASELSQRVPHLALRMKEHSHRALVFAQRMKNLGLKVIYPGLKDHPDHHLLSSIANKDYGYGGVLCIDMGTEDRANRLMNLLQNHTHFGLLAVSLGYFETLMSCSGRVKSIQSTQKSNLTSSYFNYLFVFSIGSSTSSEMNVEEKELAGISPGLIRMSVGYVGTLEQKWSQLEKALLKLNI